VRKGRQEKNAGAFFDLVRVGRKNPEDSIDVEEMRNRKGFFEVECFGYLSIKTLSSLRFEPNWLKSIPEDFNFKNIM
jgi:hypothetical protein